MLIISDIFFHHVTLSLIIDIFVCIVVMLDCLKRIYTGIPKTQFRHNFKDSCRIFQQLPKVLDMNDGASSDGFVAFELETELEPMEEVTGNKRPR